VIVAIAVSVLVPARWFATTENRRDGEVQPAPFALVPASTESVNDRIVFGELPEDVPTFEPRGDLFFVTISRPEQSLLSWLVGRTEPVIDLETEEDKFGERTATQDRSISLQQMRTATQEAQYVALQAAGYDPEITLGEVVVQEVLCAEVAEDGTCREYFPSDEQIDPADTILEADGVPLQTVEDLAAVLEGKRPGDLLDLRISRPRDGDVDASDELDVTVELAASPDDPDRTIVGFVPFDTRSISLPFDVGIDTAAVGGPSAGLAFTLALVDELTEGELTGGRDIAATGTISLDGTVGPIGGLEQKVKAVQQHGVSVFLIPASQIELAPDDPTTTADDDVCRWECLVDAGDGQVVLVPVADLDAALAALETLGGDPLVPVDAPPT
jgi:PDZ domain-containing protein